MVLADEQLEGVIDLRWRCSWWGQVDSFVDCWGGVGGVGGGTLCWVLVGWEELEGREQWRSGGDFSKKRNHGFVRQVGYLLINLIRMLVLLYRSFYALSGLVGDGEGSV